MALTKGTNSYATVAEADTYFSDRIDVAAWTAADSTQKAQALVTASGILDDRPWTGVAISEDQPLAFPRNGSYFDPRLGTFVSMSSSVPNRIFVACIELAHHLCQNDGLLDDTGRSKDLKVGSIELTTVLPPNLIPPNVKRMIKPILVNGGSANWWRSN
jgi:hypothetical protein